MDDKDNFSLYRCCLMSWFRLPLFAIFCFIGLLAGIVVAYTQDPVYPITASVKVHNISTVDAYSKYEIANFFLTEENLVNYSDENHKTNDISRAIGIEVDGTTGYINFIVPKTSDCEFWINFIGRSISNINEYVTKEYLDEAQIRLEKLRRDINRIQEISENSEERDLYSSLVLQESALSDEIEHFTEAFTYIQTPLKGDAVGKSPLVICFIFTFLGSFAGIIAVLISVFRDKTLYLVDDIRCNTNYGEALCGIPEYKKNSNTDKRYFEYMSSVVDQNLKKILVFSFSNNPYLSDVAEGLCAVLNQEFIHKESCDPIHAELQKNLFGNEEKDSSRVQICLGNSFCENPSVMKLGFQADCIFVLLQGGIDSSYELRILDQDLERIGCKVYYVLNSSCSNDEDVIFYENRSKYKSLKYRF